MMGMPVIVWALVAIAETLGGVLILIGGFTPDWVTRLGGLLIIPPMLGAIFMVHWPQWSFVPSETHPMGGMEFQVSMLLLGLFFLLRGKDIEAVPATT
jgi:putative oxidoreductase